MKQLSITECSGETLHCLATPSQKPLGAQLNDSKSNA